MGGPDEREEKEDESMGGGISEWDGNEEEKTVDEEGAEKG
jgi:hypothetical protein